MFVGNNLMAASGWWAVFSAAATGRLVRFDGKAEQTKIQVMEHSGCQTGLQGHLLQGSTYCAFRDVILQFLVVTSGYLS